MSAPQQPANFRDALIAAYNEAPCQVLPNALWKTLAQLETLHTDFEIEDGAVVRLQAWNATLLLLHWTRDRRQLPELAQFPATLGTVLLHQDYLRAVPFARFSTRTRYFRLLHRYTAPRTAEPAPPGFSLREVQIETETAAVAAFIGKCYEDLHPTPAEVASWVTQPDFAPDCWLWMVDDATGAPVGLGIAGLDATTQDGAPPEGSLEWIQVLPEARGRRIGRSIVLELLSRLEPRAQSVTVSGQSDNTTHPEILYRSCGFTGDDSWWVLQRHQGKELSHGVASG